MHHGIGCRSYDREDQNHPPAFNLQVGIPRLHHQDNPAETDPDCTKPPRSNLLVKYGDRQ
ncbi:hypothetical protein [Roseibium sp.]|uniref:hypothetical protein n=1 Tax=Roseibium sp. TaxID=1936156 RepID=UPI003D0AA370